MLGRDAKNVSQENALSHVAAYTVGNDVSSRKLQRDPTLAGRVPQWGFSKGFDTFAPLGPCLVAGSEIADPKTLLLKTVVDGEVRQEEGVSDLLFDCAYLISYLSQGTTLQKGSVIMTGTPGGEYSIYVILLHIERPAPAMGLGRFSGYQSWDAGFCASILEELS